MKLSTHTFVLYGLIVLLLVMSTQRHARLNESVLLMKDFQGKSSETRLHFMNEIEEIQNRIAVLEHKHGIPSTHTVRPTASNGNRSSTGK